MLTSSAARTLLPRLAATAVTILLLGGPLFAQSPQLPSKAFSDTLHAEFDRNEFEVKRPAESRWLDGGTRYTILEPSAGNPKATDLVAYDTATGNRTILVSAKQLIPAGAKEPIKIDDYTWSADGKRILIFTNAQKVWRLRTRGDYWLFDPASGKLMQLGKSAPAASMMFAKFSPDGSAVAYVSHNNLYAEDLATESIRQLTTDGSDNIINGTTDWVTEEELSLRDGFRWSPDSKSIAYWQFDQSGVQEYALINDTRAEYPAVFRYKYPHPGGTNAAVKVGVIPATGGTTQWIKLPGDLRNNYIPRMDWIIRPGGSGNSSELVLQYLNRLQNDNQVYLANAATGDARLLFEDKDPAWVDYMDRFDWVSSKGQSPTQDLLWISERDGWRHAWLVSRTTGQPRLITDFPGDVIRSVSIDEANGYFYFLASPTDPIRTYLYRSRLDGTGKPERVTPDGQTGSNTYDVAPNGQWAIHSYSSATHPPSFELVQLPGHKPLRTLVSNEALIAKEDAIDPTPIEFTETQVTAADGKPIKLNTFIVKPPDFDPHKKYPMLVNVYGEPAATTVKDSWGFTLNKAIAREGYIVVSFDNQGTPSPRGRAWRKSIYRAIGIVSSREQDEAITKFAEEHAYVDTTRMGMWGHSGGGSSTLQQMFRYPGHLQAGVSLAPVPDMALYDSIYQERYLGLPGSDNKSYHDGSAITHAEGLTGHLLIIHGSGDDNVHFQGTEMLVNKLIELGKPFDFMDYPNRTHALSEGPGTLVHRYNLFMRYMEQYVPAGPR